MIAIQRRGLFGYLLFLSMLIVGLGVFGYLTLIALPTGKAGAERFLMVSVLAVVVALIATFLLYRRSRNLDERLRRARARVNQGGFSARSYFRDADLGGMGELLAEIFSRVEEISEKKSLRIGALNSLVRFLLDRSTTELFVTNGVGVVFQVSKPLLEREEIDKGELRGTPVGELLPQFDFDETVNYFYREGSERVIGAGAEKVTAYPVFDAQRNLAYSVIVLGEEASVELPEAPEAEPETEKEKPKTFWTRTKRVARKVGFFRET